MTKNKNLSTKQKAKLIAAYLMAKDSKDKKKSITPWKTLTSFRNV